MIQQLIRSKDKWGITRQIDFLLLLALMVSFFLHYRINGFIVMLLIIYAAIKFGLCQLNFKSYRGLFFFPALFFLLLLGQFYSDDLRQGWTLVERNISLIALPIAVASIAKLPEKWTTVLIDVFITAAFGAALFCLGLASYNAFNLGTIYTIPNNTHFLYNTFMHHQLSDPIGMHAVYFSLFIAFSNLVLLNRLFKIGVALRIKVLQALLVLFFCVMLYLLKSANIVLGFGIGAFLVLFYNLKRQNKLNKAHKLMLVFTALLITVVVGLTAFSKLERFTITPDFSDKNMSALDIRFSIWSCSWDVIKENIILGAGTGDSQIELRKAYENKGFTIGAEEDFNAHNMYLQYWMSNGLLAVGLLLIGFFILIRKGLAHGNVIFIAFVLLFALFSLTESTLRTQKGLVFFVAMASMFYWRPSLWDNELPEA